MRNQKNRAAVQPVTKMHAVLHVEDRDEMAVLFRESLDEAGIPVSIYRVSDGEQALLFLRRLAPYEQAERPEVVFLDLNMPGLDGWQLLREMRSDEALRCIPAVVLSSSNCLADKDRALALGAQHYVVKPEFFTDWISEIGEAYLKFVRPG